MESRITVIHTSKLYRPIQIIRLTNLWATVPYFFNFSASNTIMLYNTTLIILLGILRSLRSPGSANRSFGFGIPNAAIEICRCVEYSFS